MTQSTVCAAPGSVVRCFLDGTQLTILSQHEQELWDAFVAQSPHGHLLQCWAWGELKRSLG